MELTVSREASASPDAVWAVLTDIDRSPQVLSAVTAIERLDGGDGFGVGTRWRETREMFGQEATEEMEVTALDEGHSYTVEAESRGTNYHSVLTVEPTDRGSMITMTFSAEQVGGWINRVLAKTLGRLFVRATRTALQQDVDDIAATAEVEGASP